MDLLARIHDAAARDEIDEPARRAYARSLGDDPRARFIELQLDRVRDGHLLTAEESQLLVAHWRAWVGAPAEIVEHFGVEFARGFWDGATYFKHIDTSIYVDPARRTPIVDAPAWGTVRRLHIQGFVPPDFLHALIGGPLHRSVRTIRVEHADALARIATWDGPFLALRELQFFPERLREIPSEFPGLPELLRLHVHIRADLAHEPIAAMQRLAEGPGSQSQLSQLALTMFGGQHFTLRVGHVLDRASRCAAPTLRSVEIGEGRHHVHLERGADGTWSQLRVVWQETYGNHPTTRQEMIELRRFVADLPPDYALCVQVPEVGTPPEARTVLDEIADDVAKRGGRLERVPPVPFPPAEITAV